MVSTITLPPELVAAAQFDPNNLSSEVARLLALELYRERRVSLGRAAELCGMPLADFMSFAVGRGVPVSSYSVEDFEADRESFKKLPL